MKAYLKCYRYRLFQTFISLLAVALLMLICGLLFGSRLKKVSNQLSNYNMADYNIIYCLNYDVPTENVCVYPDSDIPIYLDEEKSKRLSISVVMKKAKTDYNLDYLDTFDRLGSNQIILSANTADKYGLNIGDEVYAEFPNKSTLSAFTIGSIKDYEYDYSNPNLVNDVGVAFIDTDVDYIENNNCKYILFSKKSQAEYLSDYPQVINEIINKRDNSSYVFNQGLSALFFILVISVGAIILIKMILFSKSYVIIKRLYLKGISKSNLVIAAIIEKTAFTIIPILILELTMSIFIPNNSMITTLYYSIPLIISLSYIAISTIMLSRKLGKGVIK